MYLSHETQLLTNMTNLYQSPDEQNVASVLDTPWSARLSLLITFFALMRVLWPRQALTGTRCYIPAGLTPLTRSSIRMLCGYIRCSGAGDDQQNKI